MRAGQPRQQQLDIGSGLSVAGNLIAQAVGSTLCVGPLLVAMECPFVGDFGKDRTRLAHQSHVMDIAAAEMEAFDAEAIIFAGAILFDIAARFEGGEDAEDVVLVQLEAFGKFGDAEFVALAKELFEDVERMRHGLDNVVCLVAPHHWVYFPGSRRSAVVTDPQFWKTVLL